MNSFDNYIEHQKELFNPIDEFPLSCKRSLDIYSGGKNNVSNYLSTSAVNNHSSILFQNRTTTNKKYSKFLYSANPTEISDFSTKYLELDIQLSSLKKKLADIKEQRKQSEMKVNLMKLRINKLQNEEKISIRDLENTKKSIKKIQNNRKKAEKNNINKAFSKKNHKSHNLFKNKALTFINDNKNGSFINNSNLFEKKTKIGEHNSFHVKGKTKNLNNNFKNYYTPKPKSFVNKNGQNNSNTNSSNENYGVYSLRNNSINLDKININNNFSKNNIINKNRVIQNIDSNVIKKINNKTDLKTQIKQNLIKRLKKDEEERKKIQEEIRKIEKEQYNLWMNFNENMNSGNTTFNTNINSIKKINKKKDLNNNEEEDENIVNYNFI